MAVVVSRVSIGRDPGANTDAATATSLQSITNSCGAGMLAVVESSELADIGVGP